jgi:uncharacterized protein
VERGQQIGTGAPPAALHESERREVRAPRAADSLPRTLYVALPRTYRDSASARYPVVYVLDGDGLFGMTSEIQRWMTYGREIPEALVVALGHGRPYVQTLALRNRNFTPAAHAARPGSGHGAEFLEYLEREVIPLVDSLYRTRASDRTLVGFSLGGLFAAYAMFERPTLFRRLILVSPATYRDDGDILRRDAAFAATRRPLPAAVYLSIGGAELSQALGIGAKAFADTLAARRYGGLRLTVETLAGETHLSTPGAAIARGLKAVFRDSAATTGTGGR